MKYYPMHMHLHSIHQPGASMESHMYNAKSLGMQYIHFTDHDTRTGRKYSPVESFDFTKGELKYLDCKDEGCGWNILGEPSVSFENGELVLSSPGGNTAGIRFFSDGKRHTWALLSEVILTFGFKYVSNENSRIVFDITLSQRPPEHKEAHFRYVIGKVSDASTHVFKEVAMPEPVGGVYRLNISDDVAKEESLGGLDNTFSTVSIYVDGDAEIRLNRFEIKNKYNFDELVCRQRELAQTVGKKYGIKPFVTSEISGAGQHKNCFTSSVPIINYYERDYKMSEEDACEYLRSHGAVFSYNHPFEAPRYKRKNFTREDIENIIKYETESLSAVNVYGAAAMEVGFPEGRGLFTLTDYLRLWDNLSLRGVFITGDGDSDSHYSDRSWFDANNFATWIAADENIPFPIPEEVFNQSILSGNCYMGDPTRLKGDVEFFSGERSMGAAIRAYESSYGVTLRIGNVNKGASVRFIKDGELLLSDAVEGGNYEKTVDITPDKDISFLRAELYDTDGRCIMLTNPIYFVKPNYRGYVPRHRAGYIGSSQEKRDAELMTSDYKKEIELPAWLNTIKGKKILHIGDTESWRYHFYRKLINRVRPDVIIHTGDMSDEVKAGRMSEVKDEYVYKISYMAEMLKASGAELIIVPGNNDISEEIKRLIPEASVVKNNTLIDLDGAECRVGHEVSSMIFDKKWSFYGHGFTGDHWEPSMNQEGGELRFNACYGPVVCSIKDGKFHQFSLTGVK